MKCFNTYNGLFVCKHYSNACLCSMCYYSLCLFEGLKWIYIRIVET